MGRFGQRGLGLVRRRVEALWGALDRIEPSDALVHRAGDLAEEHGLRAYDAVHLASVEQLSYEDAVLAAADGDLLAAARERGFATSPV